MPSAVEIYANMNFREFYEALKSKNINEVMALRIPLITAKGEMERIANMSANIIGELAEAGTFSMDNAECVEHIQRMTSASAQAFLLNAKMELLADRQKELTPDCFKNHSRNKYAGNDSPEKQQERKELNERLQVAEKESEKGELIDIDDLNDELDEIIAETDALCASESDENESTDHLTTEGEQTNQNAAGLKRKIAPKIKK
jgi:hypothetical protein